MTSGWPGLRLLPPKNITMKIGCYKMRPMALIALLTLASISIAAAPARAEAHPVCLAGGENNALQCEYATLGQCRATASGGLGYCVMNPTYASGAYARYEGAAK